MQRKDYDRERACAYAKRWAFERNPLFYNFTDIGGNCTNFISQCIYAGGCAMNYERDTGWFYISPASRAPAWTSVGLLHDFLTANRGAGPFAEEAELSRLEPGDVIQLRNGEGRYYHSLLITGIAQGGLLVAANSFDAYDRPLGTYRYAGLRGLRILGVRRPDGGRDCFKRLLSGHSLT